MITLDGKQTRWQPGLTLDQVIAGLENHHLYAVARLNGIPVSRPNFSKTAVADGDVIEPIPLIAGG